MPQSVRAVHRHAAGPSELNDLFHQPEPLHRYPNKMAGLFHAAVQHIEEHNDGDASGTWAEEIGSARLVRRFLRFEGVAEKSATMAANILVRDFRIELSDYHYIDIPVDVHVNRVF